MGTQLHLVPPPASHAGETTSQLAEARHTESGRRDTHAAKVLEALMIHGPCTAAELKRWSMTLDGMSVVEVRRRIHDLSCLGKIAEGTKRICSEADTLAKTWYVLG